MEKSEKQWDNVIENLCLMQALIQQTIQEMRGDLVFDEATGLYSVVEQKQGEETKSGLAEYHDYDSDGNIIKTHLSKIIVDLNEYMIVQELQGVDLVPSSFLLLHKINGYWCILEKEKTYQKVMKKYNEYRNNK